MNAPTTFSILSTNAPLIPIPRNRPCGRWVQPVIPDGAVTSVPIDLGCGTVRNWRVDAPSTDHTCVVVTDSPFGAFVTVRRRIAIEPWPRLRALLKRYAPSLHAVWSLYLDDRYEWEQVNAGDSNQARARGGDVVTVEFIEASDGSESSAASRK